MRSLSKQKLNYKRIKGQHVVTMKIIQKVKKCLSKGEKVMQRHAVWSVGVECALKTSVAWLRWDLVQIGTVILSRRFAPML